MAPSYPRAEIRVVSLLLFALGMWACDSRGFVVGSPAPPVVVVSDSPVRGLQPIARRFTEADILSTSITPITNISGPSSGFSYSGDSYSVRCSVTSTVTLYPAVHDGTSWTVFQSYPCALDGGVETDATCIFPATQGTSLVWNAFKTGAGSVSSCTASSRQGAVPASRAPPASGPGSGTVTSVGLSLPTEFTVTGSPVTTSGTLTGTWRTETANTVFAGPASGGAATPGFRALTFSDTPTANAQCFTGNGTWSKPSGANNLLADFDLQGPGGGGGSGGRQAATAGGGGGGGGGGRTIVQGIPVSSLPSTMAVIVGTPGSGGAAITANSTNGNAGSAPTDDAKIVIATGVSLRAGAGGAGSGGTGAGGGTGGSAGQAFFQGQAGFAGGLGVGSGGTQQQFIAAGGGGGGGGTGAGGSAGGAGRDMQAYSFTATSPAPGGIAPGGNGGNCLSIGSLFLPGGSPGGGGGTADGTTAAGQGGSGTGCYGVGGGGGGASKNGSNSGAGGPGGPGYACVYLH